MKKYIVSAEEIINTVESSLKEDICNAMITEMLMTKIDRKIIDLLQNNCEEYKE